MLVMQSSVTSKKPPGKRIIHHELPRRAFSAIESILPQDMDSTGRPSPIKLSVDSAMIALRTFITTINIMEAMKFGFKCFHKT